MERYERPVVDPQALFYHGTHAFFERFEDSFRGSNTAWTILYMGFSSQTKRKMPCFSAIPSSPPISTSKIP